MRRDSSSVTSSSLLLSPCSEIISNLCVKCDGSIGAEDKITFVVGGGEHRSHAVLGFCVAGS